MATEAINLKLKSKTIQSTFVSYGTVKPKQLRNFGFIMAVFFGFFLGLWPLLFRHDAARIWALWLALPFLFAALFFPSSLKPVYQVWMCVGGVLGWVNTRLILSIVFFLIFTPIGLILRLLGKEPLKLKYDKMATTYRTPLTEKKETQLKMQF